MITEGQSDESVHADRHLPVLLAEYGALKAEQLGRIGFRDNLLYATVGAVGAIGAVALGGLGESKAKMLEAFLLVPWVTTILGWTYLVNDDKITSIREYIDAALAPRIRELTDGGPLPFEWERFHRADAHRRRRKGIQLAVDLVTFVVSGIGALAFFLANDTARAWPSTTLVVIEALLLLGLAHQFITHDERASQPRSPSTADLRDGPA
jgi:hypothetical protein